MTGPYDYPADPTVIAQLLFDKINANRLTFRVPVESVMIGDQDRIAATPTVCIEPGDKTRTLSGVSNMTTNVFIIYVLIYHNKVQDNQLTRMEVDQIGYDIEWLIHQDLQLTNGGAPNVIHGFVQGHESGYTYKANTLYRTARLTYTCTNKTSLPAA